MNTDFYDSVFEENIKRGIDSGIITITENQRRITYHCKRDYSAFLKDPEEKNRASCFCELVLDYGYPPENIDIEVVIPKTIPEDKADIIVYDDNGAEYLMVECFESWITGDEYEYAIELSSEKAEHVQSKFFALTADVRKTVFKAEGFKLYETYKNTIADIPTKYGEIPQYRFIKGVKDLKKVNKKTVKTLLELANFIAWQGGTIYDPEAELEVNKLVQVKIKDEATTKYGEAYKFQIETKESPQHLLYKINSIYYNIQQSDDILLQPDTVYKIVEVLQDIELSSAI